MYSEVYSDIYSLMERGKELATRTGKHILVSSVKTVQKPDLPAFFAMHRERFSGHRFFWSEPGRELTLAGLGSVLQIEASNASHRYEQVERAWNEVLQNSLVLEGIPEHAGPLLFGGFSFFAEERHSSLWQDFSHTHFTVPQFMLTQDQDQAWLTTNVLISPRLEEQAYFDGIEQLDLPMIPETKHASTQYSSMGSIKKEEFEVSKWMESVEEAALSIRDGLLEKVVLARHIGLKAERSFDSESILKQLLCEQVNTYVFEIDHGNSRFIGATPERLIKRTGNDFFTLSLAGSIARGSTAVEDEQLGRILCADLKNSHEHAVAVQMIKRAMIELCEFVEAPDQPTLHKLKDIQHLATPIFGQAREGISLMKAVERLHPTPALGGAPHDAAMKAIRKLEHMDRGWYAAPIGWMNRHMEGEFVAAIRSALVQGEKAVLFAGCGVMGDSDPISEFNETALKFRPMLSALQALHTEVLEGM